MNAGVSVIALISFGLGVAAAAYAFRMLGRRKARPAPAAAAPEASPRVTGPIPDSPIPDHAQSGRWERFHLFDARGAQPQRNGDQVYCHEAPLAMVCPECDLRQPALGMSWMAARRQCDYCGVILQVRGSRLYWWRRVGEGAVSGGEP